MDTIPSGRARVECDLSVARPDRKIKEMRMKLASLDDGTRDGRLVIVSPDITPCSHASHIAPHQQAALDSWDETAPQLNLIARGLESGGQPSERFHERNARPPLPRAFQWADGSAYVNHIELVRQARGAAMPPDFLTEPLMYQGGSDSFLDPRAPVIVTDEAFGVDMEGEIAVITGDVPLGADRETALAAIRLVMLVNDVSLRNLIPGELAKGFGFFQSKPSSAFSPVAVTPEGLGEAWREGVLHGVLCVDLNGEPFGRADAGIDMTFDFGALIVHAAQTRPLGAGTIIGSGTVSNKLDGGPGKPVSEGGAGYSCIAEQRVIETIQNGAPETPYLGDGDIVRIEMRDPEGHSIFGAIEQQVELQTHTKKD
jgi:fumarylacetoacetate (FAA) hydrolase